MPTTRLPPEGPVPLPVVTMGTRWAVDGLSRLSHQGRDLVGEVLVVGLEGPDAQDGPEDLVGLGSTTFPRVHEEHQVDLRLPVELEDHEYPLP